MPISKMEARELMRRGYESGAVVLNGTLHRQADGTWAVEDRPLDEVLAQLEGQEVIVVASQISEGRGKPRLCRACGTEYEGYECPRCRQVRERLRGRS